MSTSANHYKYLAPDPESSYRQFRVKGRRIFARTLYSLTVGGEGRMTAEEVAADYELPLEAVQEAIAYCESNPPEIAEDLALDEARAQARGMNAPASTYNPTSRPLTPEDRARNSLKPLEIARAIKKTPGPLVPPWRTVISS
jgi:uncharacterized protein (DUF433 family)